MSTLAKKLMMCTGSGEEQLYVDDVFSTYLYTGNGSTQTITNGIDLAGEGGLTWVKNRDATDGHRFYDTERGATYYLESNATTASTLDADGLTAFTTSGFSLGADVTVNTNSEDYASWTFRNATKFFNHTTVTKSSGTDATASFTDLETLGMVAVKRTDSTGSWYVWHRSLTAGKLLYLEQIAAEATLGHITVSGTTVTLEDGVIADGSYVVYAWAHDTADDGMIQCGSYVGDGTTDYSKDIDLGWEPQYVLLKNATNTGANTVACAWNILDIMRGFPASDDAETLAPRYLSANDTGAEGGIGYVYVNSQGFIPHSHTNVSGDTYIYMAIHRPNKPPESGTDVFAIDNRNATLPGFQSGFIVDMAFWSTQTGTNKYTGDRLRSGKYLYMNLANAEQAEAISTFDYMDGWFNSTGVDTNLWSWMFRRAPGFFDVVAYTGTGTAHTEDHNLGVVPEMMILKGRDYVGDWPVYQEAIGNTGLAGKLNTTGNYGAQSAYFNNTSPTASVFTIGTDTEINWSGKTYIAYLFATLDGISKVGSYTGNGTTQTIDCGFSAGARFILIKRTDSTGDWYVWDSVRGIIAVNDPHLSLNTTAAEVTTDDSIDPDNSGFIVNQVAATNINVSSADYIFLAIA